MKKNFIVLLAICLLISIVPAKSVSAAQIGTVNKVEARANIVNIGLYRSWAFTSRSTPDYVTLYMDADFISIVVECENPEDTDELVCNIIGTENDYAQTIPCTADGEVETIMIGVPRGEYKVNFEAGDSSKKKINGFVVFSIED